DDPSRRWLWDLARPLLTAALSRLNHAAGQNLEVYEHLHQVRILGKRLRYAMEVFADCFASEFRAHLYRAVEEMQEVLGRANDSYVARGRLQALSQRLRALAPREWRRYRPELENQLYYHQARLPQERQCFQEWWQRWRQHGGEAAFFAFL